MKILVKELDIGMCIGEDVYTDNAMLVVANHTIITDSIISRLELFRIKEVEIIDIELDKEAFTFDVTKTQEFLVFKENSTNLKDSLSNSFNGILTKNPDPDEVRTVLDLGKRLFDENKGNSNILDILHNMQAFSDTTYMHCVNVGIIAALIGTWLEWPENEVQLLVECGLFHDIGKLATPPEILNKPGKLTNEEYAIMKQHTVKGYQILLENQLIDNRVKIAALLHHERCDGGGYPFALRKEKIDKFSKVIAIADVYDALTANRVYRGPMCPFDVIAIFEREGLRQYETRYIMTFLHKVLYSYLNSKVQLNNGVVAEIVQINPSARSKPVVMMDGGNIVDLSQYDNIKIESIL